MDDRLQHPNPQTADRKPYKPNLKPRTPSGVTDAADLVESYSTFRERNDDGLLVVSLRQHHIFRFKRAFVLLSYFQQMTITILVQVV
jgi:hypothetical protein